MPQAIAITSALFGILLLLIGAIWHLAASADDPSTANAVASWYWFVDLPRYGVPFLLEGAGMGLLLLGSHLWSR